MDKRKAHDLNKGHQQGITRLNRNGQGCGLRAQRSGVLHVPPVTRR